MSWCFFNKEFLRVATQIVITNPKKIKVFFFSLNVNN